MATRNDANLSPERDILVEMGDRWWTVAQLRDHLYLPEPAAVPECLAWLEENGYVEVDRRGQASEYRRTGKIAVAR